MLIDNTQKSVSGQIEITDEQIHKLCKQIFPEWEITEIRYLAYAFTNKTILLYLTEAPHKVVIKICVNTKRFEKLKSEIELIERLHAETELPIPQILHADLSLKLLPFPFVFYSFLHGENLVDSMTHITNREKVGQELAQIAAKIHKVKYDYAQFSLGTPDDTRKWVDIIQGVIDKGVTTLRANNYHHLEKLEAYLKQAKPLLVEPESYTLIHRDMQPQNFHWDNEQEKIVGFFDFESAMAGDYHFEFSLLERMLFREYPELKTAFYEEYRKHNALAANFDEVMQLYNVARDLYFYTRSFDYKEFDRATLCLESIERMLFNEWEIG